jgi:hypothetical protein
MIGYLFKFEHPKHGTYYVWHEEGLYGISRVVEKPHCGYATLNALFKSKGL